MVIRSSDPKRQRMAARKPASRADVVRTRRVEVSNDRVEKRVQQINHTSASVPVITMRTGSMGTPVVRRASTHPRMKLSLPLDRHGVEVRLPAIPVISPSWRMLSGALVIILSALLVYLTTVDDYVVKNPTFKGISRIDTADLEMAALVNDQRIFMIDPLEVKYNLLTAFPELKDVTVEIGLPAKVTVKGTEREPLVTWKFQDSVLWIDKEGTIFPARGEAQTVLTISSDEPPPMVPAEIMPDLLNEPSLEEAAAAEGQVEKKTEKPVKMMVNNSIINNAARLSAQIPPDSTLVYSQSSGLGWMDAAGWNVYVGQDLDQIDQKMLVYQQIVNTLNLNDIHPKVISVEYVNAPFYRLE